MTERDTILVEAARLLEFWGDHLRSGDLKNGGWIWNQQRAYDDPQRDTVAFQVRHIGIPYAPGDWLGRSLSAAERQAYCRAIKRLADLRELEPVARWGDRTTHYRLTPKGLQEAVKVCNVNSLDGIDLEAVGLALQHCKWTTPEHVAAVANLLPADAPSSAGQHLDIKSEVPS